MKNYPERTKMDWNTLFRPEMPEIDKDLKVDFELKDIIAMIIAFFLIVMPYVIAMMGVIALYMFLFSRYK